VNKLKEVLETGIVEYKQEETPAPTTIATPIEMKETNTINNLNEEIISELPKKYEITIILGQDFDVK